MHHGQSWGERNIRKVCKKQVKLSKTGGICQSRGEIIIFAKQRGKCTETGKIGGKIRDENLEIFREKVKLWKFSSMWKFLENRGEIRDRGENASWAQGGWTPLAESKLKRKQISEISQFPQRPQYYELRLFSYAIRLHSLHLRFLLTWHWETRGDVPWHNMTIPPTIIIARASNLATMKMICIRVVSSRLYTFIASKSTTTSTPTKCTKHDRLAMTTF